ncbi:hypothetical protein D4764_14G0003760 [Takifugu flavidus]|uniref:DUF5641 domain-containing protein n=1 Tax=Takifugu flavidus TaxID=433684 RepID=A0A5C6P4T7_9TELE|nr:hypothetical protein D4764_14G0003760 [Takifugu flavidus]
MAIAAVAYLRALDFDGKWHVGFVMGKSKLAPYPMHTVPRLELCAAVLAVELAEVIQSEMDIESQAVRFFTDRRFYTYVANRVARIRSSTEPKQWQYMMTDENPADHGTSQLSPSQEEKAESFELVQPDADKDIRPQVTCLITKVHIFKAVQEDVYEEELKCLTQGIKVHRQSPLARLDPYIDENGLIRVGGGRRLTLGIIFKCVICKKLRGKREVQKMSELPADRELQVNTDDPEIKSYLQDQGCTWTFNAPHSSHMGGAWERLIGVSRRILDGLLIKDGHTRLTHEVLSTLMAEVMAIMNAQPLVPISYDAEIPEMLSPATLLTQKASLTPAPLGDFKLDHLCKVQWRQVQSLADSFWKRWRVEYLATLQPRRSGPQRSLTSRRGTLC